MMGFRPLRISQRGLSTISPSSLTPSSGFGAAGVAAGVVEGFSAKALDSSESVLTVAFGAGVDGAVDGVLAEVLDAEVDPPLPGARGPPPRIEKSENHGV